MFKLFKNVFHKKQETVNFNEVAQANLDKLVENQEEQRKIVEDSLKGFDEYLESMEAWLKSDAGYSDWTISDEEAEAADYCMYM